MPRGRQLHLPHAARAFLESDSKPSQPLAGPATRVLLETLRPRLDRYEWLYAPIIGPGFTDTYAEHAAIIRAVAAGNGPAAERAVRRN